MNLIPYRHTVLIQGHFFSCWLRITPVAVFLVQLLECVCVCVCVCVYVCARAWACVCASREKSRTQGQWVYLAACLKTQKKRGRLLLETNMYITDGNPVVNLTACFCVCTRSLCSLQLYDYKTKQRSEKNNNSTGQSFVMSEGFFTFFSLGLEFEKFSSGCQWV